MQTDYDPMDTTLMMLPDTLFTEWDRILNVRWWVWAISGEDTIESLERFTFEIHPFNASPPESSGIPAEFAIQSIFSNPFNARTQLSYSMNCDGIVGLRVYDFAGREILRANLGQQNAGYYRRVIDATDFSSGIYFIRLISGTEMRVAKFICIK